MPVTPEKDPNYIYAHPYATLIADEYRMRGGYRIVRPSGTDDHLMLLTRAGRGLFRTRRGTALDRAFAMNALENICLRLCAAIRRKDTRPDAFIDTVNAFIREHLSERLTVARLAAATGALSPSRFAHTFTAAFGVSPQAYVESCRLEYAKRLLETTNASVKEASYAAGFADPLYFSRRFRRAYGLPPREIAKHGRNQPPLNHDSTILRVESMNDFDTTILHS